MMTTDAAPPAEQPSSAEVAVWDTTYFLMVFWKRVWLVAGATAIGIGIAMIFLNVVSPRYSASIQLVPTEQNASSVPRNLSGLASLAGINVPRGQTSQFPYLLSTLTSREVAADIASDERIMRHIFHHDWDAHAGQWREPKDRLRPVKSLVKSLLGMPVKSWRKPSAADLQRILEKRLTIEEDQRRSIATLSYWDSEPQFAAAILHKLYLSADERLRMRMVARMSAYIEYVDAKLRVVTLAEHREALAKMLADQEQSLMLASAGQPFAADGLGQVAVGDRPAWPNVPLVAIAGALLGALAGLGLALWLDRWQGTHRKQL